MWLNLLDTERLLKLSESKLSKVLPIALRDVDEIIQHLKSYEVLNLPDGSFFCEMRCRKGVHVTIKVAGDIIEWQNVFCRDHCKECVDKDTFCKNFGIVTQYRLFKLKKSLEKLERTRKISSLEIDDLFITSNDETVVIKENLMP